MKAQAVMTRREQEQHTSSGVFFSIEWYITSPSQKPRSTFKKEKKEWLK
jgi:hypothetical protein